MNNPQPKIQLSLADHQGAMTRYLRNPAEEPQPQDLDKRRVGIYLELVFNNIESQLSAAFPVINSVLSEDQWTALVREFIRDYRAQTPYFSQLSAEFVTFLSERAANNPDAQDPEFLLELAHYERIELDLYMLDRDQSQAALSAEQLLDTPLGITNVAVPLAYQYPVHQISPDFQPEEVPSQPTCLLLFQGKDEDVRFFELQPMAYHLVVKLYEGFGQTGRELLQELANAMQVEDTALFIQQGEGLLKQLYDLDVLVKRK